MNDDLLAQARKYILQNEHVSVKKLYDELHRNREMPITQKKIAEIKGDIHDSYENLSFNRLNKKVVFPYIGGWFFDILDNRGKVAKAGDPNFSRGWAVFCHGNSGYIVAFPIRSKAASVLTRVYHTFKQYCENLPVLVFKHGEGRAQNKPKRVRVDYPIKHIVSDMEKGWGKNFDTGITKMNASENHRFLSRVNAFASQLRKRFYGQGLDGNEQRSISNDEFEDFVADWNLSYISWHGITRGQMLTNKNLELAYIARALYYNQDMNEQRHGALTDDDIVTIREPEKKFNAPTRQNRNIPSKYRVMDIGNNQLKLVNINNDKDVRNVHWNDVRGRYKGAREFFQTEKENLEHVEMPRVSKRVGSNVVHIEEPEDNREKAEEAYNEMQEKWMALGFPANFLSKDKYEMINKLKEKLDQDTINYVIGEDINKKRFTKPVMERIIRRLSNVQNLMLEKQNIPKTDGFDKSGQMLTRRGRPYYEK